MKICKDIERFVSGLELRHFSSDEIFYLGAAHYTKNSRAFHKNSLPARELWLNIIDTIKLVDTLRKEIGLAIHIDSGYRNKEYNKIIGGSYKSQHIKFSALDIHVTGMRPTEYFNILKMWRDEGRFAGGLGLYKTFVHVDTRGYNATW